MRSPSPPPPAGTPEVQHSGWPGATRRTPIGIEQETYALLVTYQLLRTAMADATTTRPGTDPDRTSYKATLNIDILTPADP